MKNCTAAVRVLRSFLSAGILVTAGIGLGGCGGGSDDSVASSAVKPLALTLRPGTTGTVATSAGQPVEVDADEAVDWDFSINGRPLFGNGPTVVLNGLTITKTDVSPSRVVIDTVVTGPFASPVIVTISATSASDATQVSLIKLEYFSGILSPAAPTAAFQ
jgi:hypothetical protein